jgi:predicted metal-dependent phosphoesterase TrpH
LIKIDLHVHTKYSGDSDITLEKLVQRCAELRFGAIAVTDHGTAEGALKLSKEPTPFKIIVGEEIASSEGEIIGLFLKATIPNGLSPEETIKRIRGQGGLVYVPHPFDHYRSSALQRDTLERIAKDIDIVEVFNARTIPAQNLTLPAKFATSHNLLKGAGSDSHSTRELGRAYVNVPDFEGPGDFLKAMSCSEIHGRRPNAAIYARSLVRRSKKKIKKLLSVSEQPKAKDTGD